MAGKASIGGEKIGTPRQGGARRGRQGMAMTGGASARHGDCEAGSDWLSGAGRVWQGKEMRGQAGEARMGQVWRGAAGQGRPGRARLGVAERGPAWSGKAGLDWFGGAWHGAAGQGNAGVARSGTDRPGVA